jgi:sugar phosphate isomerase/epimerase
MMVGHMGLQTRRHFLQATAATAAVCALATGRRALASPFGLPLGLQLYSVREQLPKDYAGTLRTVAALGYREVEAAGFYGRSAAETKQAMTAAGLRCVSAHYPWAQLSDKLDGIIEFHKQLGAEYIICASPGHKPSSGGQTTPGKAAGGTNAHTYTLDDWRWNAEQFNRVGAKVQKAGLRFGYHNHIPEFVKQGDVVPYDELLRLTDPKLVTFEMDCGWVTVGGADPVAYLKRNPDRISMLHVKDFQRGVKPPHAAELGHGSADYKSIFQAVKPGTIKHYFVEQEQFDLPWQESLKIDADYMKALTV